MKLSPLILLNQPKLSSPGVSPGISFRFQLSPSGVLSMSVVGIGFPLASTGVSLEISARFTAVPRSDPFTVNVTGIVSLAPVLKTPLIPHRSYVALAGHDTPLLFQSGSFRVSHAGI